MPNLAASWYINADTIKKSGGEQRKCKLSSDVTPHLLM
jgi:hypothetical protein